MGVLVWAVCRYECHALETGSVPTITRHAWRFRRSHPWHTRTAVAAGLAWLAWHLLLESDHS